MSSQSEEDTAVAAGSPVAEQSLRTVIRENVDGMLVIDREGVVVFANPAAERLLSRPAQVLEGYLPQRLGAEAIAAEVSAIVAETGAAGPSDMGKVMAAVKARLAGKADMGQVSAAVKAALAK